MVRFGCLRGGIAAAVIAFSVFGSAQTSMSLSSGCYWTSSLEYGGTFNSFSSMDTPAPSSIPNTPESSSSLTPATSPLSSTLSSSVALTTSSTPTPTPFIITVNDGTPKARRRIRYIGFQGDTSVLVDNQQDAALFILTSDGYLMSGGVFVGTSLGGSTVVLQKLTSPPSKPFHWTFNGTSISFGDSKFCYLSNGDFVTYVGQQPDGCSPVAAGIQVVVESSSSTSEIPSTEAETSSKITTSTSTTTTTTTTTTPAITTSSFLSPPDHTSPPPGTTSRPVVPTSSTVPPLPSMSPLIVPPVGTSSSPSRQRTSSSMISSTSASLSSSVAQSPIVRLSTSTAPAIVSTVLSSAVVLSSSTPLNALTTSQPTGTTSSTSSGLPLLPSSASLTSSSSSSSIGGTSSRSASSSTANSIISSLSQTTGSTSTSSSTTTSATPILTGKRGLAYSDINTTNYYQPPSQVSWAYNYFSLPNRSTNNVGPFPYTPSYPLKFYPLLFNDNPSLTSIWFANVNYSIANYGTDAIFSFNEPDACFGGLSSCMPVARALTAYSTYIQPFAGRVLLGAPAVTNAGSGFTWLSQFLGNATQLNLTIDFINLHWYASPYNMQYFQDYMAQAVAIANASGYAGRPIWITEYGMDNTYQEPAVLQFLRNTTYWVDIQNGSFIPKTCWFGNYANNLLNANATARSTRGDIWNSANRGGFVYGFNKKKRLVGMELDGWEEVEREMGGALEADDGEELRTGVNDEDVVRAKWNWKSVGERMDESWLKTVRGEEEG